MGKAKLDMYSKAMAIIADLAVGFYRSNTERKVEHEE